MRITDIETFVCSYAFPEADRWYAGGRGEREPLATHFNAIVLRVHTDEGISGLSEIMPWSDIDTRVRAVREVVGPRLVGRSPFDADKLTVFGPDLDTNLALAAANVACWDIVGKATDTPLYRLLDTEGLAEPRLRCYASGGVGWAWFDRPEQLIDEALEHRANGFTAMKLRIGTSWGRSDVTVGRFLDLLGRLRDAVGPEFELMLDANMRFSPDEADEVLELARGLRDLDFRWFEDPIMRSEDDASYRGITAEATEADSVTVYRRLREESGMSISGGETTFDPRVVRRLIDSDAVDIVNLDVTWVGLDQARRFARWLEARGKLCIPHSWTTAIGFAATAHFVAAIPNRYTLEHQTINNRLMDDLVIDPVLPEGGYVTVSERPGLGIELDEAAVAGKFQRIEGDILTNL